MDLMEEKVAQKETKLANERNANRKRKRKSRRGKSVWKRKSTHQITLLHGHEISLKKNMRLRRRTH